MTDDGKIKAVFDSFSGTVCKLSRREHDYEGESRDIADILDSVCAESAIPVDTGRIYDSIQYSLDYFTNSDSEKEL